MKIYFVRVISLSILLVSFINIFRLSSQTGDESSSLSGNITRAIVRVFNKNINEYDLEKEANWLEPYIRKLAHFSSYAIIGMSACCFIATFNIKWKYRIISSIIIGLIYATTDEVHQLIVPERSGEIVDVLIDTLGVATGAFIIYLIIEISNRIKNKKKTVSN